jgi:hypothetical protein
MAPIPAWRTRALSYGLASFLVVLAALTGLYSWAT